MGGDSVQARPARTVLEQYIRDRRMTLEEFAQHVEQFAREHGEPGMLGTRHLQRLIAGKRGDGRPLGPMKPTTARLIERVTGERMETLLAAPHPNIGVDDSEVELRQMLHSARRVDRSMLNLLYGQLQKIRQIDRRLGAQAAKGETEIRIRQVESLLRYCITVGTRQQLALLLAELYTLAGWQALDGADRNGAWGYYHNARAVAAESDSMAHIVHAAAEQAYVLLDLEQPADAVQVVEAHAKAAKAQPAALRAWLAAVYGEAQAAIGARSDCFRAFDRAETLLPNDRDMIRPYLAIDAVHLARWRGHALARLGEADAVDMLMQAHKQLHSSFVRARAALTVDLATALFATGENMDATRIATDAIGLAIQLGSERQRRRVKTLLRRYA